MIDGSYHEYKVGNAKSPSFDYAAFISRVINPAGNF